MKLFLSLTIGMMSFSAWSYSIPSHLELSKLSGELIKYCGKETNLEINDIIKFSGDEDSSPHKGCLGTRLGHWHFYNNHAEEDVWFVKGVVRKTFHTRWKTMEKHFLNISDIADKSKTTGSLIHFIQDVTNPSHVVPVYHGPGRKDKFDYYPILSDSIRALFPTTCKRLEALTKRNSASYLLHSTAKATQDSLNQKISFIRNGIEETATLEEALWTLPTNKAKGFFGDYGILENNFGETKFKTHYYKKLQGPRATKSAYKYTVEVKPIEYRSYALQQQLEAVVNGAALIMIGSE